MTEYMEELSFHRVKERNEFCRLFRAGESITLISPRRIGKTWVMKRLIERDSTSDLNFTYVDLQNKGSVEGCLKKLYFAFNEDIRSKITISLNVLIDNAFTGTLDSLQNLLRSAPIDNLFEATIESTSNSLSDYQKHAILLDEIPLFTEKIQKDGKNTGHRFLSLLCALREKYENVVWMFTGSTGWDRNIIEKDQIKALKGMRECSLDPFNKNQTKAYIDHLSNIDVFRDPIALIDPQLEHFCRVLSWCVPEHIKVVLDNLDYSAPLDDQGYYHPTEEDVDKAINRIVTTGIYKELDLWKDHIKEHYANTEKPTVKIILSRLAGLPEGESINTLNVAILKETGSIPDDPEKKLKRILRDLERDGFLTSDDEGSVYKFRSGLIREYWKHNG